MKNTANLMDMRDQPDRLGDFAKSACFDADALNRVVLKIELTDGPEANSRA